MDAAAAVAPLADTADEGRRMMAAAREDGVAVRLIGGVAFELHKHGPVPPALQRAYADIDVVVRKGHDVRLKVLLANLGYEPDCCSTACMATTGCCSWTPPTDGSWTSSSGAS